MKSLYRQEHICCPNYDQTEKPTIEVVKIVKGEKKELSASNNEIVFIIEGRMRYYFQDIPAYEAVKGQILFRPVSTHYSYEALSNSLVVIFRIHKPIELCCKYSLEKLYGQQSIERYRSGKVEVGTEPKRIGTLEINSRIWYFLDGLIDCIADGIGCRCWFETKINEFFGLLRFYYTKETLSGFFYLILSGDTAFSEYVRLNWKQFRSVCGLAESMNITPKQFSSRFIKIFGKTPYRWIMEKTAQMAYHEITSTKKPFKEIAVESGFNSDTQFTRFCKNEFNKTPTELREESRVKEK